MMAAAVGEQRHSPGATAWRAAELETLYDALTTGVGVFDRQLVCVRANRALAAMIGVDAAEMAGKRLGGLTGSTAERVAAQMTAVMRDGQGQRQHELELNISGEPRSWTIRYLPLRRGRRGAGHQHRRGRAHRDSRCAVCPGPEP